MSDALEEGCAIPAGTSGTALQGQLTMPPGALGVVVFAHGSGSSRFSPRNRSVAEVIRERGLGTLLIDLLTAAEAELDAVTAEMRFDIGLLTDRVVACIDWLGRHEATGTLPVGCFGASTGAAAALAAAAARPQRVEAVVARGGRPDLVSAGTLAAVRAPTLLIVGSRDMVVLRLNEAAAAGLTCETRLIVVPGATHLFEEPGALDAVARAAADWFGAHLTGTGAEETVSG